MVLIDIRLCGQPVVANYEPHVSRSRVSAVMLRQLNQTVDGDSFLASVDCGLMHWAKRVELSLSVSTGSVTDIVLGRDWMSLVRGVPVDHSASSDIDVVAGHSIDTLFALANAILHQSSPESSQIIARSLALHSFSLDVDTSSATRIQRLAHLVTGQCWIRSCPGVALGDFSACEASSLILQHLLSRPLTLSQLQTIVRALHIPLTSVPIDAQYHRLSDAIGYYAKRLVPLPWSHDSIRQTLDTLEQTSRKDLLEVMGAHGIDLPSGASLDNMRNLYIEHYVHGCCATNSWPTCKSTVALMASRLPSETPIDLDDAYHCKILCIVSFLAGMDKHNGRPLTLCRVVQSLDSNIGTFSIGWCPRKHIRQHLHQMCDTDGWLDALLCRLDSPDFVLNDIRRKWPQVLSDDGMASIIEEFKSKTNATALDTFVCASCSGRCFVKDVNVCGPDDFPVHLFAKPSSLTSLTNGPVLRSLPAPLQNCLLDPDGITSVEDGRPIAVQLCGSCRSSIACNKIPALSLSNGLFLGPVPPELQDLTFVEEVMIARCRAKAWIVKLQEEHQQFDVPNSQRGLKGHVMIYPQDISSVAAMLPPSMEELSSFICVLFVGSSPPTKEWLLNKAKPLLVRRDRLQRALSWLKAHNPLYSNVAINMDVLASMGSDAFIPPIHIEHVAETPVSDTLTSRYDQEPTPDVDTNSVYPAIVVTDVDVIAPAHELRAAALRHFKSGGSYMQIPHGHQPSQEFGNSKLLPMTYPTLFPYGIGGPEDPARSSNVGFERHVKHLLSFSDRRFQTHYSFPFTVFNIIQRRQALLNTSLKVKRGDFDRVASSFASVSLQTLNIVTQQVLYKGSFTATSDEERKAMTLMREVKSVTSGVYGSAAERMNMRNQLRALVMEKGLPSFYLTINPADVYNPIVRILSGQQLDVDTMFASDTSTYWRQSTLVAENPFIAAQFFNIIMKTYIEVVLGYKPRHGLNTESGVLGVVKAYYGCVEAQGRGTLHCHMVVWIEGALNGTQIRDRIMKASDLGFRERLLVFLDTTICNDVPADPNPELDIPSVRHHPCSVVAVSPDMYSGREPYAQAVLKDLHLVVSRCQVHKHSKTCYKYWKGPPSPRVCRFGLGDGVLCPQSWFNEETGELELKRSDLHVNNYNRTSTLVLRSNTDIKWILSGPTAKSIFYYISEYITKHHLKPHVAYAALEYASQKLGNFDSDNNEIMHRGKRLLQRCAYAMISHQELSAQQVLSYLCGFEDHFTSHIFRNLYWSSFESLISKEWPSPECAPSHHPALPDECSSQQASTAVINPDIVDVEMEHEREDTVDADLEDIDAEDVDAEDDTEIAFSMFQGKLQAISPQVVNYQLRPLALEHYSLWEFAATTDKVRMKSKEKSPCNDQDGELSETHLLFLEEHPDYSTHCISLRSAAKRLVPVPRGPPLPRPDDQSSISRHARLMLIFFKPWRHACDLRQPEMSWTDSYSAFMGTTTAYEKNIVENMQVLHECKDSRDDHFEKLRSVRRDRNMHIPSSTRQTDDDFGDVANREEAILEHLESIDTCNSLRIDGSLSRALACADSLERCGLLDPLLLQRHSSVVAPSPAQCNDFSFLVQDTEREDLWQHAYDERRRAWKKQASRPANNEESHFSPPTPVQAAAQPTSMFTMISAAPFNTAPSHTSTVVQVSNSNHPDCIDSLVTDFSLNTEQARAFKIIGKHVMSESTDQLRMFLAGPGGTGKSRVLSSLREFFNRRGQSRRFRMTSYTGVAAQNIGGMTLHTALCLGVKGNQGQEMQSNRDLIAMWEGVDYLFVDEVSMIGCPFLVDINHALTRAKGNTSIFGGINIIFCGDFAQLPPVGQTRLFSSSNTGPEREKNHDGQMLWRSVDTVVELTQIMRQTGSENDMFVDLLDRLRRGSCSDADFELLNTRLPCFVKPDWCMWFDAPILVNDNATKDFLNERAVCTFAHRTGKVVEWYHSADTWRGLPVTDNRLQEYLWSLPSNKTKQRLGRLPLVEGMPVMVTLNYDVVGGIVNGSIGTLQSIRYVMNHSGKREAISCVVKCPGMTAVELPSLNFGEAAILQDTVEMKFVHPYSPTKCCIKRRQLPIVPAFALTVHKSQGQTLSRAVVDLQSCSGTEAPYVMLSRVRDLQGVMLLQPFDRKKISVHPSGDLREEKSRLHIMEILTRYRLGNPSESAEARSTLQDFIQQHPSIIRLPCVQQTLEQVFVPAEMAAICASKRPTVRSSEHSSHASMSTVSPHTSPCTSMPRKRRLADLVEKSNKGNGKKIRR